MLTWRTAPTPRRRVRLRSPARDDAVSEVVGSALTVGITAVMMVGVFVLFLRFPAPLPTVHAELSASLDAGAGGWGTGDEALVLEHLGGDPLPKGETTIFLAVDGVHSELAGDALGSAFADGTFTVGETWARTATLTATSWVEAAVASGPGLVWSGRLDGGG